MGRYYWLKLKRDFFKRADVMLIESMPNGKDYILFYLKLMVESIDHEGRLRFNEAIPYNENMLATITNTNIDIVRSAVQILTQMGLMEMMDDGTYFMSKVNGMIGSETEYAAKKRNYREQLKDTSGTSSRQLEDIRRTSGGQLEDNSRTMSETMSETMSRHCPTEKDIDIDIDIDKDPSLNDHLYSINSITAREANVDIVENVENVDNSEKFPFGSQRNVYLTLEECDSLSKMFPLDYTRKIEVLSAYLAAHPDKHYESHYGTLLLWDARDKAWQQSADIDGISKSMGFADDKEMIIGLRAARKMMSGVTAGLEE